MYDLILRNVTRHITLTPEQQAHFTSLLRPRSLRKRQYLLQAGDVFRYECFVTKGCLRTYETDDKGQDHIVHFAFEDWWTGDLDSFLTGQPSSYTIDALEDSEILMIDRQQLEQLYQEIPAFNKFFRILMQNALIAMQRRIGENLRLSAEERYRAFTQRYPQFEQRLSLRQIAAYLGITPESLSRIRKQLARQTPPHL